MQAAARARRGLPAILAGTISTRNAGFPMMSSAFRQASLLAAVLLAAVTATPAAADAAPGPAASAGNPEHGRKLSYACLGCHGVPEFRNAYPRYRVPKIGGQSAAYLAQALDEYRKGSRRHPTMQMQARSFSDQDIADLATYLSTLK